MLRDVQTEAHDRAASVGTPSAAADQAGGQRGDVRARQRCSWITTRSAPPYAPGLARPHTELLETLAEEIVAVCFANPLVEACRVSVVKPDIFNEAAAAGIEFYRLRPA